MEHTWTRRWIALTLVALAALAGVGALAAPGLVQREPIAVARAAAYSGGGAFYTNFTVSPNGYVTVYLYGAPPSSKVLLWWGLEPHAQGPQGAQVPWYYAVPETINGTTYYVMSSTTGNNETAMTYNSSINAFVVTVGPFLNGTWMAYVININGSTWVNYEGHAFWNFNVFINPPVNIIGYTRAWVLPNGSIVITTIGRAGDTMILWYGLTNGSQTGLPWYNVSNEVMQYNPLSGNFTAMIGPFKPGQWVQWVYHDNTTGAWIHNSNVSANANFAIQDVYLPIVVTSVTPSSYVYVTGQTASILVTLQSATPANVSLKLVVGTTTVYQGTTALQHGTNTINITFPVTMPEGIYNATLLIAYNGLAYPESLPPLYVINTTGRKPISVVIVWNMHQPLYLEPNGSWGQVWAIYHVSNDMFFNGQLVGAYLLQAKMINNFSNLNVTIDFTPVLLYQWEAFLHQSSPVFLPGGINVPYSRQATEETLTLYQKLVKEGRLQVLTVPFYHPLMAIEYDNGWASDLLAQILMGEKLTQYVFGVRANGAWTPEMALNDGLIWLYNETGINVTILDYQAFIQMAPDLTVVSGSLSQGPYGVYVVENSMGQRIYVLFRDTNLSNMFSFIFFGQSSQLTAQEFAQYLAKVYLEHPGGVVVIALDGENPIIFNPMPNSAYDLEAIYQVLSEGEKEGWLVTQTVNQAIATHPVAAVLTNLPEESWATSLNNWNNGYIGKIYIWRNVSLAREYLVALSNMLGMPVSPVVNLSFAHAPNASISWFEATTHMPYVVNTSGGPVYNPYYMYYTLWNYLYVSEGSDWTFQAGPPNYGPLWFSKQPIIYDSAIDSYVVNQVLKEVYPVAVYLVSGTPVVAIENGLLWNNVTSYGVPLHVIVVLSNGAANVSAEVTLGPGINYIAMPGLALALGAKAEVYLYAPVTYSETGGSPLPVSGYGLFITSRSETVSVAPITITTSIHGISTVTMTTTTTATVTVPTTTYATTTLTSVSTVSSLSYTTVTISSSSRTVAVVAAVAVAVVAIVVGIAIWVIRSRRPAGPYV